jgi:uncharacterized protein (UPF0332 family)
MVDIEDVFAAKARESLSGAESEFVNGRYNNCANRCYYRLHLGLWYILTQGE